MQGWQALGPLGRSRVRHAVAELLSAFAALLVAELVVVGLLSAGLLPGVDPRDPEAWGWLLYGPARTILAVGLYAVLARAEPPELPALARPPLLGATGWILLHIVAATGGSLLIAQLMGLLGTPPQEQAQLLAVVERTLGGGPIMPAVALVLGATLLAPISEELFFRALMFRRLGAITGLGWAYAGSAFAFGFVHGNLSGLPVYFWLGLCFASVYVRTGRLWAAIVAHVANNGLALSLLFLAPPAS